MSSNGRSAIELQSSRRCNYVWRTGTKCVLRLSGSNGWCVRRARNWWSWRRTALIGRWTSTRAMWIMHRPLTTTRVYTSPWPSVFRTRQYCCSLSEKASDRNLVGRWSFLVVLIRRTYVAVIIIITGGDDQTWSHNSFKKHLKAFLFAQSCCLWQRAYCLC